MGSKHVRVVQASEPLTWCRDMLSSMHGNAGLILRSDLRMQASINSLPPLVLDFHGIGFPCQSFSGNGKREGDADQRLAGLVAALVQFIRAKLPKCFFLENVELFQGSSSLQRIMQALWNNGYGLKDFLVNSISYVPQFRFGITW